MQLASFSAALFALGAEFVLGLAVAPHAAISSAQQMPRYKPERGRRMVGASLSPTRLRGRNDRMTQRLKAASMSGELVIVLETQRSQVEVSMADYSAHARGELAVRWRWFWLVLVLLVPVGVIAIEQASHTGQAQVPARAFPIAAGAARAAAFMDCSLVRAITYYQQNPCETFVLVTGARHQSNAKLLAAERSLLKRAGWQRPTTSPEVDRELATGPVAGRFETWIRVNANACAFVTTLRRGIANEERSLFPAGNAPQRVHDLFAVARRDADRAALWIRLQPLGSRQC